MVGTHRSCEAATLTITAIGEISGYELTLSSTLGGSVHATFHEEEMMVGPNKTETLSDVPAGTVVTLVAQPQECYYFLEWTGDAHTIAEASVGQTTITADDHYSVTASFRELPADPTNWALVGGIAAGAAAVVGLVIFLMRRKKAAEGERH